jgi:hypothetical protein
MEEEHRFQQENVYRNDKLVQHRFYEFQENDEMQARLIVEEIVQELCNQLNFEYELLLIEIENFVNIRMMKRIHTTNLRNPTDNDIYTDHYRT